MTLFKEKRLSIILVMFLIVITFIFLLSPNKIHAENELLDGLAINEFTNVYEEKDLESTILRTYSKGSQLIFWETESENWYKAVVIIQGERKEGYIYKDHVELITNSPVSLSGFATTQTNVYQNPSQSSNVLKSYSEGSLLYYQTYSSEWYQAIVFINGERNTGYIHAEDVEEPVNEQISLSGISKEAKTYVYDRPSRNGNVLRSYNEGRVLYYKTYLSEWYEAIVIINGERKTGYIHIDDVAEPTNNPVNLKGVALKNRTNVYTNANASSKVLKSYSEGSMLQFQTFIDGWYQAVVFINGERKTGYIKATDVELPTTSPINLKGIATKDRTSVYTSPNKNSKVLRSYNEGSILLYKTFINDWYEAIVIINGERVTGYIHANDVENITNNQAALKGYSKTSRTSVYKNPSKKSEALRSYSEGRLLQYRTFTENWYEATVILNGQQVTGYIHKNDVVDENTPQETLEGVAISGTTYVYDSPSRNSKRLKGYSYGSKLIFKSFTNNWYEAVVFVNGERKQGFIHNNDVVIGSLSTKEIVNPKQEYTYEQMVRDIKALEDTYPGLVSSEVIGKSVDNRDIYAVRLGRGDVKITISASTHAREWISTNLVMYQIDQYSQAYFNNKKIDGYDVRDLLNKTSIYYVPMVNPDGVTLVQKGASALSNSKQLLRMNNGSNNFKHWKSNANGVDLNRNYPLGWNSNLIADPGRPSSQNLKGYKPLSEPESIALSNFSLQHDFKTAIAYHSSGEVLYWEYGTGKLLSEMRQLAQLISDKTGYPLRPSAAHGGGYYTHWFTEMTGGLSATPELSPYVGNRPVPISNFDRIWRQNHSIGLMLAEEAYKNRNKR